MNDTWRDSRYDEKRSVTDLLVRTLTQSGLRPSFSEPSTGRVSRLRRIVAALVLLLGLGAVSAVLLWPSLAPPPVAEEPVAVLELGRGAVHVLPASAAPASSRLLALDVGQPIRAGTFVETRAASDGGPGSRAAVRLAGGPSVRLDAGTRVQVASSSALVLERGAVYVDSAAQERAVEVRTTLGVVRDIGTQFEVRLLDGEGALRVRVREGKIVLERDAASHEAEAGVELAVRGDGTVASGTVPIYGPHWDWVLDTAPVPEIEDRPLRVALDWVVREGGLSYRLEDDRFIVGPESD